VQVGLALTQQLPQRRRARRQAEADEVQRGEQDHRRVEHERQIGEGGHHGVGQHVPEQNHRGAHPHGLGGAHVLQVAAAQEFGAHQIHQGHPREQQHDRQQDPESGHHETGDHDDQVENRHARPDFHEALAAQVQPAAVVTLHRAHHDADQAGRDGQDQAEQHRQAEAVNQAGQHVAALVVGAQPVFRRGGRRRRHGELVVDGVVAVANRRPQHPAVVLDQFRHIGVAVVGFGFEQAAEGGFRVGLEHREIEVALILHHDRPVVGDEFRSQTDHEQHQEQAQRPEATAVATEGAPLAPPDRIAAAHQRALRSKSIRGSTHI
jgi:hypothetical protein